MESATGSEVPEKKQKKHLHVFDGSTERVSNRPVVNGFFTKTKVGQFYVTWRKNQEIFRYQHLRELITPAGSSALNKTLI